MQAPLLQEHVPLPYDIMQVNIITCYLFHTVRRQFPSKENPKKELQLLDYQSQQYRLLPLLATAYAMHFTGERMQALYNDLMAS